MRAPKKTTTASLGAAGFALGLCLACMHTAVAAADTGEGGSAAADTGAPRAQGARANRAAAPDSRSASPTIPKPSAVTAAPLGGIVSAGVRNSGVDPSKWLPGGRYQDILAGAALLARRNGGGETVGIPAAPVAGPVASAAAGTTAASDPSIRLAIFGDAGNSYTNGTSFYYTPGSYKRYDLGASGPLQQAVADMMRSWNPTDVIQLGDESYNVASSSLLDYNIGQYYNNWIYPYAPPAFTEAGSIYTDGTLGGIDATPGKTQWPYNLYDYPNGFPNPSDPRLPGGSPDRVNHYFAVPGNHDGATILGTYNDASVNQVNYPRFYIGRPIGPDAYDYKNNIANANYTKGERVNVKVGSTQALVDYHAYFAADNPGNLKPGSLSIGKLDTAGYGMYYGVDLGDAGDGRPLLHVTIIDTSRLLADAGYYSFNFAPNPGNPARNPNTGQNTEDSKALIKNPFYDVREPLTAADAWFQPPGVPLDAPSIGRAMYLWAKDDLESSDAVWKIVMGHHPAYHVGNSGSGAEDSYTSNSVVLDFLAGLRDVNGAILFDTYMNGHSHAYGRVLEMTPSADGIGTGIPFFTTGNGGKVLDALNLAPYGTNVLSPMNYSNFIGYKAEAPDIGKALYNYDINNYGTTADPTSEASSLAPYQASTPTSVGVSGYYSYSKVNWPQGTGYVAKAEPEKLTITSVTVDPYTETPKTFDLKQPAYLSFLSDQADLSGLYGFGSGAAQLDAGDGYMMMHYKTAQPIDPAIALIGRGQGITDFDPGMLFYNQWSPSSAKADDLALFSFDIDVNGSLTNVQLVNRGNGYFESDLPASSYLTVNQDFEILGNNPATPLGFSTSDPTRAVVRLSFSGGQLTAVNLVNPGTDYGQVASAVKQCNYSTCDWNTVTSSKDPKDNKSLLVGVNIDLEAQYTLAASRPAGAAAYHDWYLITDTAVGGDSTAAAGSFGSVNLSLQPRSPQARDIIATTPRTTGYNGKGPQTAYPAPQTGGLRLRDSLGQVVGSATVEEGKATVTLNQLPAPGALQVEFDGDATSSYQVNFRGIDAADDVTLDLDYGVWSGPVSQQGSQLVLSEAQLLQVMRTDSGTGLVTFGLSNGTTSTLLVSRASGARSGSLQSEDLFLADPNLNWQATEGRTLGSAGSALVTAGSWSPTAVVNGRSLALESLQVESNGVLARFAAGRADDPSDDVLASFTLAGTGNTTSAETGVLTVRRLSGKSNGLALYEADPVTGAVVDSRGTTWLPGQTGYVQAALTEAKRLGLVLRPSDMPAFGETLVRTDLPVRLDRNYGALLLVNGSETDVLSSYAAANFAKTSQALSLIAPGRGVSFSFEDLLPWQFSDRDFNDVIVTVTPAVPTLSI